SISPVDHELGSGVSAKRCTGRPTTSPRRYAYVRPPAPSSVSLAAVVITRVSRSGPAKVQDVTLGAGTGTVRSSSPVGEKRSTAEPFQRATQTPPSASTHSPSG